MNQDCLDPKSERDTQLDQTDQSNQVAVRPQLSAAGMSVVSLRHAILT